MRHAGMIAGTAVLALTLGQVGVSADWKTKAVKKTVGNLAQEGIENAVKDSAVDAALNAVGVPDMPKLGDVGDNAKDRVNDPGDRSPDDRDRARIGSAAGAGLEAAMTVADVGSTIENTMDVANATKKINKARKVVR